MTILSEKIAFAEKHIKNKEGVPWSLKGREWVRDEFWLPADGWKLWRYEDKDPCDDCADRIGEIVEHPDDNPTRKCRCGGLCAEPILVTVINLERGDGKTFNLMGYSLATLFKSKNKSIAGLWASEDQGKQIFAENWEEAIAQNPALSNKKRSKIYGTPPQLLVHNTKSRFEVLTSSHRSLTGRRRTHILVDEARDIKAQTLMALLPSTNAMGGVECPAGHVQLTPEDVAKIKRIPKKCTACGRRLTEWFPRVIIASAAGVLRGTETDWLHELVEELEANPHKNYHLFTSEKWGKSLNPRKNEKVSGAITDVFGKLTSTRHYAAAEYGNTWTMPGEDIMTAADVKRVMDKQIENDERTHDPTIGFFDSSMAVEKTSLVLFSDNQERSTFPWEHVYMSHLKFWWPGHGDCRSWKRIKPEIVERHLRLVLSMYSRLVLVEFDTKTGAKRDPEYDWPFEMFKALRKAEKPWSKKLRTWKQSVENSTTGWELFSERVTDSTMALQHSQEIIDEIKGVMLLRPKQGDQRPKVVDRNRRRMHKDITECIANACWMIRRQQVHGERRGRKIPGAGVKARLRAGGTRAKYARGNFGADGM